MTKIEWTDRTWNPLRGCSHISPGCTNCYAATMAHRFSSPGQPYEGLTRMTPQGARWNGQIKLVPEVLEEPLHWRKPQMVFVNSMSDLFHEAVPFEFVDRVFAVMALTPWHTYQVLTKRPERMAAYMQMFSPLRIAKVFPVLSSEKELPDRLVWPLPNVWLGTSVENQPTADERIPHLLQVPAAVRFLSMEPLLGAVDLTEYLWEIVGSGGEPDAEPRADGIDWIIVGGESGPHARPMHPDWVRSIRDQCQAAGVPFFFKQWGEWRAIYERDRNDPDWRSCDTAKQWSPNGRWLNLDGGEGFHGQRVVRVDRMGKKLSGHLLDGQEWRQWPEVAGKGKMA